MNRLSRQDLQSHDHTRAHTTPDKPRAFMAGGARAGGPAGAGAIGTWIYNDSVNRIDIKTNKVSPYFDTGTVIDAIAFGVGSLWVAHGKANQVTRTVAV